MHLLVLDTHITNGGKINAMLNKDAGDGSNSQLILKWPRCYIFLNDSQAERIWQYRRHQLLKLQTGGGGARLA